MTIIKHTLVIQFGQVCSWRILIFREQEHKWKTKTVNTVFHSLEHAVTQISTTPLISHCSFSPLYLQSPCFADSPQPQFGCSLVVSESTFLTPLQGASPQSPQFVPTEHSVQMQEKDWCQGRISTHRFYYLVQIYSSTCVAWKRAKCLPIFNVNQFLH